MQNIKSSPDIILNYINTTRDVCDRVNVEITYQMLMYFLPCKFTHLYLYIRYIEHSFDETVKTVFLLIIISNYCIPWVTENYTFFPLY